MTDENLDYPRYLSVSYLDTRDEEKRKLPAIDLTDNNQMGDLYRTLILLKRAGKVDETYVKQIRDKLVNEHGFDPEAYYLSDESFSGGLDGLLDDVA